MAAPDPEDVGRTCKPFAANRSGLVLGEGAAFLVLESARHARARGAPCHAYLTGYGVSSDAHHIGMPAAEGQVRALRAALADAGLSPADIGYVNAHATATGGGDIIEATSLREVFGAGPDSAAVSSTKSVHGHLIGATSALELLVTVVAMQQSLLPASADLDEVDPRCELNHVGPRPLAGHAVDHALSFSCGFGGTNVALVVSRNPTPPVPD
jgi:3-oxoacyl-[acyl-carrier-protein] synthase II